MADQKIPLSKGEVCESLGSVFWLLLDFAWFKGSGSLVLYLAPLAVITNALALILGPRKFVYITLNSAANFWLLANVFWIIADMKLVSAKTISTFSSTATTFFCLAILTIALTLIKIIRDGDMNDFFYVFRRLRIRIK